MKMIWIVPFLSAWLVMAALGASAQSPARDRPAALTTVEDDEFVRVAAGLKLGTLGIGAEIAAGFGDYVNLRAVGHRTIIHVNRTWSDVRYDASLDLSNAGLILDFNTQQRGLRLCGGVFYNGIGADGDGKPIGEMRIGGIPFSPQQIGTIRGDIKSDRTAYYAGFSFGNPVDREMRLTLTLDLGVLILPSKPSVRLVADGELADTRQFEEALRQEEREIRDRLIRFWPVVSFGLHYQF